MARTLDPEQIAAIAAAHERARRTVTPIDRVTKAHPDITLDDAYAIQQAWVDLQVANGASIRGHKIGLTSRAMQQAMRIDEPDFGALLDDMFLADGATVRAADYIDPKIEVELAFVLRDRLDAPDVTAADVYAATDHIIPALELIDARSHRVDPIDGTPRTVRDTIADNAADAAIVTGGSPVRPGGDRPALGGGDHEAQRHRGGDRRGRRGARRPGDRRRLAGPAPPRARHHPGSG